MSRERYDTGIDWLRLAAAILVIAIHTSPLADFSETGNFILTRVLARIAVPFFFITSGYFLLSRYHDSDRKLRHFLKKTGWIYGASILLYLPLNFRNGYFSQSQLLPELLKDLIFDGTMYHLWYLPASMLGMLIAWKLVEKLDFSKGLVMALLLYLVGLFGDSYYVVVEKLPLLKAFYDRLFELFDYTRNGLFFAPVFLMLGGFIADERRKLSSVEAGVGFLISLGLLLAEALILHRHGFQRHDSMYVFLLPAMYFLFHLVLLWKGRRIPLLRPASLVVYLIHPLVIAAVWRFSSQNSLFHFGLVCLLSLLFSFAMAALWLRFSFKKPHNPEKDRAYIELNLANLTHNVSVLKAALPANAELMGVVKREAYGHGSYAVAAHLEKTGVKAFAVATIDEGIALRRYGIRGEILILGFTDVRRAKELKTYRLTQTLIDFPYAEKLNRQKIPVSVHIAIDSGMHRLGLDTDDLDGVQKLFQMKHLHIQGIFTHLCCADSRKPEDISFTRKQIRSFYGLISQMETAGLPIPKIHLQSSYGLLNYPDLPCDYVRAGISLYGVFSSPDDRTLLQPKLRPVLALQAKVVLIREISRGETVGYGRTFRAERNSRIAILPIGYGDGLPRNLSGKAMVRISTHLLPVIGRICMDQLAIDLTGADDVSVGDTAILIDNAENSHLLAPNVAALSGSISNELLCRLGARLPVVIAEEAKV